MSTWSQTFVTSQTKRNRKEVKRLKNVFLQNQVIFFFENLLIFVECKQQYYFMQMALVIRSLHFHDLVIHGQKNRGKLQTARVVYILI